jgi:ABC-type phosphate transport system substrate-binding protein
MTLDNNHGDFKLQKLRDNKPNFGIILAIIFIFTAFPPVVTAIEIVVNKTVSTSGYSKVDIRAIFTMQKRLWSNNKQIKVYTLPDSSSLHKEFVKNDLNMLPHQVRRVWDRMTYSGTGVAPIELESEQDMIDKIATTPDSIGYLNSKPDNENIRSFEAQ